MNFLQNLHRSDLVKASQVVMLRLYTADGSGATHAEIVEATGLAKSAVGMALDQLEKLGIVERRIHARDMRVSSSYLTADGRAKTENMLNAMVAYVDDIKKRERRAHP
jgi:DNA-binding MarR family transcriptional regulator